MSKINLPKEILKHEAFKVLSAKEKEEYIRNLLRKILELNQEGITISQIRESSGLTYSTVWHHLEVLSYTAQCHKISRGNIDVYYPMGESSHLNEYAKDKVLYSIDFIEESKGAFVRIHEKRQNNSGNWVVCSGLSVPFELMDNLVRDFARAKNLSKTKAKK